VSALLVLLAVLALSLAAWLYRSGERTHRLQQRIEKVCVQESENIPSAALFIAAQKQELWHRIWHRFERVLGELHTRLLLIGTACGVLICSILAPFYVNPLQEIVMLGLILSLPEVIFRWQRNRKLHAFEQQFPVALDLISRAVATGSSIQQAFAYVSEQVDGQVGELFLHIVHQLSIGVVMRGALDDACERIPSRRLRYFSVAVVLNLESGGQLSEVLQKLSREMQQQRTREQKLIAMTAEPRSSARIVGLIPVLIMAFFYFFSPDHIEVLLTDPTGQLISFYAIGSVLLGLLIIEKMTRVSPDE
jgi:tight adherence protein B